MSPLQSRVVSVGDVNYLMGAVPVAIVSNLTDVSSRSDKAVPVTVIDVTNLPDLRSSDLYSELQALEKNDDVMSSFFFERALFKCTAGTHPSVLDEEHQSLRHPYFQADLPRPGPYFLAGSELYSAFRLYEDSFDAFVCGIVPSAIGPSSFEEGPPGYIPVPSRHYYAKSSSADRPLNGMRVAVKDIYDVQGITTTAGSKAYAAMQKPADKTAQCIEKLIRLGAIVIGKTKTVQFASGMAAADWEDYSCPINARGDRKLDPECSSSGSGASVAAYEWLDFAIGSDTLGSMTGPAGACGIFGLRPSLGLLSSEGGLPVSPLLDTPGHFSRSLPSLLTIARSWPVEPQELLQKTVSTPTRTVPTRILIPEDRFSGYIASKRAAMKSFCEDISVSKEPETGSIDNLWKVSKYNQEPSKSLEQFLSTTVATIQLHDCFHNNLEFRQKYKNKYGQEPKVDKLIQYKWDLGQKLTEDDYQNARNEREAFRKFLHHEIFTEGTIMLLPNGDFDISYRDHLSAGGEWQGFGLQNTAFSVLGGLPAVAVPVGERSYLSKFTNQYEKQPIGMMVLGPPKSDYWLLEVIESIFASSGRPLEVMTGSSICPQPITV